MNSKLFYHKFITRVRFHEVDMLGVCNNAVYINYFETARLEYIKAAGLIPHGGIFSDGKVFFMVRNEINYRDHSRYDDELSIYSRISFIKNSSFAFEHFIKIEKSDKLIADGLGIVVRVDPRTRKSYPLEEDFINKIKSFQGKVNIIREKE